MDTSHAEIRPENALVARNIRMHRAALQMTLRQVEEATGITRATLSRIERGEYEIRVGQVVLIAAALGLDPIALMEGVV